jgi:drug/metabolite transporter (DMT)-like permease
LVLIPVILLFDRKTDRRLFSVKERRLQLDVRKKEWLGGAVCGVLLGAATIFQQLGLATEETDAGKAAFITALYVIFVPLLGLFRGKFPSLRIWFCILSAVVGLYFLTVPSIGNGFSFRLARGDLLVLVSALIYTLHVTAIDVFSEETDGIRLSCIQFFISGIVSSLVVLFTETPTLSGILAAILPILYLAVFSSGIAFTCQIVGQQHLDVSIAPIILSLESVFGLLGGALFLQETKTSLQYVGCGIMLVAVVLSQLPARKRK